MKVARVRVRDTRTGDVFNNGDVAVSVTQESNGKHTLVFLDVTTGLLETSKGWDGGYEWTMEVPE